MKKMQAAFKLHETEFMRAQTKISDLINRDETAQEAATAAVSSKIKSDLTSIQQTQSYASMKQEMM
jgi:hypothetical protein